MNILENEIIQNLDKEEIGKLLLVDEPNIDKTLEYIKNNSNLNINQSKNILYNIIKTINIELFPPITDIEIFHTNRCNLKCIYCFEEKMNKIGDISFDICKSAIDLLFDYGKSSNSINITHFGGEPLLSIKTIEYLSKYINTINKKYTKNITHSMTSNLFYINDHILEVLNTYNIKVLVSLDGTQKSNDKNRLTCSGNGSFKQVVSNINKLMKIQKWIGIKMTIMPNNVNDLYQDILQLKDIGINQFIVGQATGVHWDEENISSYYRQLKLLYTWYKANQRDEIKISIFDTIPTNIHKLGCAAGINTISILTNGEISPCSKLASVNTVHPIAKLGNVEMGLYNIKTRLKFIQCQTTMQHNNELLKKQSIFGSCYATNYCESKDIFTIAPSKLIWARYENEFWDEIRKI